MVHMRAFFPRTNAMLNGGTMVGPRWYNKKPDADNIYKFYSDCMSGVIFGDDCVVSSTIFSKHYDNSPQNEGRVEIVVEAV